MSGSTDFEGRKAHEIARKVEVENALTDHCICGNIRTASAGRAATAFFLQSGDTTPP